MNERLLLKLLTVQAGGMINEDDADSALLVVEMHLLDWNDDDQSHTVTDKGCAVINAAVEAAETAAAG